MSQPDKVEGASNVEGARRPVKRSPIFRVVRTTLLIAVLAAIVLAVWTNTTADGRRAARDLAARWQDFRHGDEAREAGKKLIAMKVRLGNLPPDPAYITLDCMDETLGDEGFGLIGKCFTLQHLALMKTDANDERIKSFAGLTRLTSLTIGDSPEVTSAGVQCVNSMPDLAELSLINTGVSDDALESIGRLPDLKTLNLSRTRVTDAGLPALTGLKKLQWLLLVDTAVTDDGVAKLEGLTSLRQISLNGSKVTAKGQARLKKMYPNLTIQ